MKIRLPVLLHAFPNFLHGIISFDYPGRTSCNNRIRRNIAGYHRACGNHYMLSYSHTGSNDRIGAKPAIVIDPYGGSRHFLLADGGVNILVVVIKSTYSNMLGNNNIVANGDRPNQYVSNPDQRIPADRDRTNSIVDCAKIFYHRVVAHRKMIKWQHVHSHPPAYNGTFPLFMKKRIYKPTDPQTGPCLIFWNQQSVNDFFKTWISGKKVSEGHRYLV
jgi:hypothetical protein